MDLCFLGLSLVLVMVSIGLIALLEKL